jgi:hypothetical protein
MIVVTRSSSRPPSAVFRLRRDISCDPAYREHGFEERRIDIDRLVEARPITLFIEKLLAFAENFHPDIGRHLLLGWGIDKLRIGWARNFQIASWIHPVVLLEQGK